MQKPSIGRIVHYRLTEQDAEAITRRSDFAANPPGNTGFQAHVGNPVNAGETYPAMIVRTFEGYDNVNLQVFLDGNDSYWATSRPEGKPSDEGDEPNGGNIPPGSWCWPPHIPAQLG